MNVNTGADALIPLMARLTMLAHYTGQTGEELLHRALLLYGNAADAIALGQHVVIVDEGRRITAVLEDILPAHSARTIAERLADVTPN